MRVVLDTNVVLASLRSHSGASFAIVQLIDQRRITPIVSVPLMFEYEEVLHRAGSLPHLSAHEIDPFFPRSQILFGNALIFAILLSMTRRLPRKTEFLLVRLPETINPLSF